MSSCTLMTLNSAFLFCFLTISTFLFPCTMPGTVVNGFSSFGVSTILAILLGCYMLQLTLYLAGVHIIKYVMAITCGAGLVTAFLIMLSAGLRGFAAGSLSGFLIVFIFAVITGTANVLWFIAAFRSASGAKEGP